MKLKLLLNEVIMEIGDGSSEPFEYTKKGRSEYLIHGVTSKGDNIDIELVSIVGGDWLLRNNSDPETTQEFEGENGLYISFKIKSINGENPGILRRYGEVNDIKYMYRFMATLRQILLPKIQKEDVKLVFYSPSSKFKNHVNDRGEGRDILYRLFLKKEFPNAELRWSSTSDSKRIIVLNK